MAAAVTAAAALAAAILSRLKDAMGGAFAPVMTPLELEPEEEEEEEPSTPSTVTGDTLRAPIPASPSFPSASAVE